MRFSIQVKVLSSTFSTAGGIWIEADTHQWLPWWRCRRTREKPVSCFGKSWNMYPFFFFSFYSFLFFFSLKKLTEIKHLHKPTACMCWWLKVRACVWEQQTSTTLPPHDMFNKNLLNLLRLITNDHPPPPHPLYWLCCYFSPTSKRNRSVFIQSHQRRVQQHRVHVLCDHTVVGRLYPRLVLVDCEREKGENLFTSSVFRLATALLTFHRRYKIVSVIKSVLFALDGERQISSEDTPLLFFSHHEASCCHHAALSDWCVSVLQLTGGLMEVSELRLWKMCWFLLGFSSGNVSSPASTWQQTSKNL